MLASGPCQSNLMLHQLAGQIRNSQSSLKWALQYHEIIQRCNEQQCYLRAEPYQFWKRLHPPPPIIHTISSHASFNKLSPIVRAFIFLAIIWEMTKLASRALSNTITLFVNFTLQFFPHPEVSGSSRCFCHSSANVLMWSVVSTCSVPSHRDTISSFKLYTLAVASLVVQYKWS